MVKLLLLLLGATLTQQPPAGGAKQADGEPTTLSATIRMRDLDLAELFAKLKENETLKLDLGYAITGKVSVVADISVPLGDAATANAYSIRGKITSPGLKLEGLTVSELAADIVYAEGKLSLTGLRASLPPDVPTDKPGELTGTATAAVSPRGDLTANLKLDRVPLGQAFRAVPGGLDVVGTVTGTAEFTAPVDEVTDMSKWVAAADFTAPSVVAYGRSAKDVAAKVAVRGGKATLSSVSAELEGIPVTGDGTLTLADTFAFTAAARTKPQEVNELQKLVPELELPVPIRGKLAADATVDGTLNPLAINASGTVNATDFAIGESAADTLSARWKLNPERVTISDLKAGLFKGTVSGAIDVPLVPEKAGEFKVAFKEVDAAGVSAAFPKVPVKLTGQVSGDVSGTLPAVKPGEERQTTADVNLTAPRLTVQGIPAEKLTGKLALEGTAVRYELEGKTLGGSFDVKGRYPSAAKPPAEKQPADKAPEKPAAKEDDGEINLRNIDLSRLTEALRLRGFTLRGVVSLNFRYSADLSDGDGRYSIRGLGFGRERLISEVSGRVRLRNGNLELGDTVGPLSGGTVRARVFASLTEPARNFYRLSVDRLDIRRLLAALAGGTEWVEGAVTLTARGKLWPEFTATGTVILARGRVGGLTVSELQVPYSLSVRGGGGQLVVRDATGTVGDGRLTGRFEYAWGANGRAAGQVKFTSVRIGNVLTQLRQTNYFGSARVTGRIDVRGESVRSADDLTADVTAALEQAAIRELPVLNTITPFLPPTVLLKPFDAGELRGRLSRGVFRIERLTLASPNADLYADGTVTTAGQLDLGVIVRTGTIGLNNAVLSQLGVSLPLPIAPLPLQVIRDVSAFLSNRTVRLTVTGTTANPQPQVNATALLTDEVVRFFLQRYAPAAAAVLPEVTPRSNR